MRRLIALKLRHPHPCQSCPFQRCRAQRTLACWGRGGRFAIGGGVAWPALASWAKTWSISASVKPWFPTADDPATPWARFFSPRFVKKASTLVGPRVSRHPRSQERMCSQMSVARIWFDDGVPQVTHNRDKADTSATEGAEEGGGAQKCHDDRGKVLTLPPRRHRCS